MVCTSCSSQCTRSVTRLLQARTAAAMAARLSEWICVTQIRRLHPGTWLCQCEHCGRQFRGGANRVRAHFGALTGQGAARCAKLNDPVAEQSPELRAAVATCTAIQTGLDQAEADRNARDAATAAQQAARAAQAGATRQAVLGEFVGTDGALGRRRDRHAASTRADDAWCRAFCAGGVPLSFIEARYCITRCLVALLVPSTRDLRVRADLHCRLCNCRIVPSRRLLRQARVSRARTCLAGAKR